MIENNSTEKKSGSTAIVIGIVILLCCICVLVAGMAGYGYYAFSKVVPTLTDNPLIPQIDGNTPTGDLELFRPSPDTISDETIQLLDQSVIPENDVYELACRLQGKCNIPTTLPAPTTPLQVGAKQKFWLINADTNKNFQVEMTLMNITPLTYFWAENPESVNKDDMKALMDEFDQKIIPTDREFFGSEWTPGVDGDPHIYVLYAGNLGSNIGGYYSSSDEYNPLVRQYSNGHEAYVLTSSQPLGDEYAYSTLAHEFVHMIQFPTDRNDVSWINEGFAEVGAFLNGYDVGGADWYYAQSPDLQLNDWATNDSPDFGSHYGQSFLYLTYFLDRFGEKATKALTANPVNDLASVDDTLKTLNAIDPQTGRLITADDVFMDWAAAMYLLDGNVGDGRYTYHNYPDAPRTSDTETISTCPQSAITRDVHQFGIDYINISCPGEHTLSFTGSTAIHMLPVDPYSGSYSFATNLGNESDMTLTREFDFTNVSGPLNFSFRTWYDLEKDYDYLYLEVSEDGKNWQIITTPSGTDENPSGNSYGWGYNGATNNWIQEQVDLSQYAGKKVQVRFEYVTDAAVTGEGFLLDDVSVDAIDYKSDFEADDGGWEAKGFTRVQNIIPQTFRLTLIKKGAGTTVESIELTSDQLAEIPLSLQDGEEAVLIVTGTTRYTRKNSVYQIEIK
ncbi:MAG: immune inhibitor A [Chloroflexi bacterium]|nr:immune inhibitor A [Chloroflexota bacterium]